MTTEQAMVVVALAVHAMHVKDNSYHAALAGLPCGKCVRLGVAAATLQNQADKR